MKKKCPSEPCEMHIRERSREFKATGKLAVRTASLLYIFSVITRFLQRAFVYLVLGVGAISIVVGRYEINISPIAPIISYNPMIDSITSESNTKIKL